ncbi:penicillin acylase family protein [Scytonema sp. UIC 10036]|uniref:penicillin acylase family protein n=1 Tax=Scytonema sp. UIC 10036 TaxID=2304196 RepID=UPI0012DA4BB2|nr:penicillin acylase family protein [Scytonema sp. UIC 10036]MUG92157.1 penicillin acylase family protein [Scytonema sp. UIC 10036]
MISEVFLPQEAALGDSIPQLGLTEHKDLTGFPSPTPINFRESASTSKLEEFFAQNFDSTESFNSSATDLTLLKQNTDYVSIASQFPSSGTIDDPLAGIAGINYVTDLSANSLIEAENGVQEKFLLGSSNYEDLYTDTSDNIFSLSFPELTDKVEVWREPTGIAHIQAQNEKDLFFAQGFVHAQDRFWQMDYQRRFGTGRLAEVLGEDALTQDIYIRSIGLYQAAESAYENLSPEAKHIVDTYSAGVNAYLNTASTLSPQFDLLDYKPESWQPVDVLVTSKINSLNLSADLNRELIYSRLLTLGLSFERIQELFPSYPENAFTILQPEDLNQLDLNVKSLKSADAFQALPQEIQAGEKTLQSLNFTPPGSLAASNNLVISGNRTTTGKPILANDPHLQLQTPSISYLTHLESPTLEAIGNTFAGLPGVLIGRNNDIAWGVTNTTIDVQDLYILEETADGQGYFYQDQVHPYEVRWETIEVKDAEAVSLQVRSSIYGPVISDALGIDQPLALSWVSLDSVDRTLESYLNINRAKNWEEFKVALQSYVAPSQNFVYADNEGNIGYFASGKIPIRQSGHSGLYPVTGTGEFDWQGFIPFEQLPQVLNPKSGFIVTANNKITPSNYPYEINGDFDEPYRAERIRELILNKDKLSIEDVREIQLDQVSLLYRDFRTVLERLDPLSEQARVWRDRLLAWDGNTQLMSVEATVFGTWYTQLTQLPAATVGREYWDQPRYLLSAILNGDPACDQPGTAPGCLDDAAQALEEALNQLGETVPTWGEIHQARFAQLAPVLPEGDFQVPFGGDRFTINLGFYDPMTFIMPVGSSYRQIVDFANLENSLFITPPGQSENPLSSNFNDQLPLWQQGEYLSMKTEDYPVAEGLILRGS